MQKCTICGMQDPVLGVSWHVKSVTGKFASVWTGQRTIASGGLHSLAVILSPPSDMPCPPFFSWRPRFPPLRAPARRHLPCRGNARAGPGSHRVLCGDKAVVFGCGATAHGGDRGMAEHGRASGGKCSLYTDAPTPVSGSSGSSGDCGMSISVPLCVSSSAILDSDPTAENKISPLLCSSPKRTATEGPPVSSSPPPVNGNALAPCDACGCLSANPRPPPRSLLSPVRVPHPPIAGKRNVRPANGASRS